MCEGSGRRVGRNLDWYFLKNLVNLKKKTRCPLKLDDKKQFHIRNMNE